MNPGAMRRLGNAVVGPGRWRGVGAVGHAYAPSAAWAMSAPIDETGIWLWKSGTDHTSTSPLRLLMAYHAIDETGIWLL